MGRLNLKFQIIINITEAIIYIDQFNSIVEILTLCNPSDKLFTQVLLSGQDSPFKKICNLSYSFIQSLSM